MFIRLLSAHPSRVGGASRFMRLLALAALVLGLVFALPPQAAFADSTITVNTLSDANAVDGFCSLREAILAANTNSAVNECAAGSGTDTIQFSVNGTIVLGSALPDITTAMIIDGSGHSITIDGNNGVRVFKVGTSITFELKNLSVVNGYADNGGAINIGSSSTVTIANCAFVSNHATVDGGAIFNSATLLISSSTFTSNHTVSDGGVIKNWGTLNVKTSTFSGNTSDFSSGAIDNQGSASIASSAFINNSAVNEAGAIFNYGTIMVIVNSSFSGNTTNFGGAIYNF
jgi:CSLREA domain-containing protein